MEAATVLNSLQLLTFTLDEELFAVEINKVREVLEFKGATKVPRVPDFMRGVINLRGNVVPVVDLKMKFGIGRTEQSVSACVIIAEVSVDGEQVILGALADAVQEVFDLESQYIEPPPKIGTRLDTAFIQGMGKRNDQFVIILDFDSIFTADEIATVKEGGAKPGE
jgi:purine-binding chemotaxis protein CheW